MTELKKKLFVLTFFVSIMIVSVFFVVGFSMGVETSTYNIESLLDNALNKCQKGSH